MNFYPTKVNRTRIFSILLFLSLIISCSKDEEFLKDAVLSPNIEPDTEVSESKDEEETVEPDVDETESVEEEEEHVAEKTPTETRTTAFTPINDAYLQSGKGFNDPIIRLEEGRRQSYLMFDLSPIDSIGGEISEVTLEITIATDDGDGTYTLESTDMATVNSALQGLVFTPNGSVATTGEQFIVKFTVESNKWRLNLYFILISNS